MLECYFDDSADQRRENYYACGGLIGKSEQWDVVEGRWGYETSHLVEPFRSTDCECGHGQFEGWAKPKRDDLMATLVGVLRQCHVYGFASIVPVRAYREAFPNCGKHDAFLLAATQTIINMAHIANLMHEDVGLWFENSSVYPSIAAIFESVRQSKWEPARRLRGIHGESKALRPLQSADLVAREAFKHSDNFGVRQTRKPVRNLSEQLYFTRWTGLALQYLAQNGGPKDIEMQVKWDSGEGAPALEMFWKNF